METGEGEGIGEEEQEEQNEITVFLVPVFNGFIDFIRIRLLYCVTDHCLDLNIPEICSRFHKLLSSTRQ